MSNKAWVGFDLDATLATYNTGVWKGPFHIGAPIPRAVAMLQFLLQKGFKVKIMTARVAEDGTPARHEEVAFARLVIKEWLRKNVGTELEVTNEKDEHMILLVDDRVQQVEPNTGIPVGPLHSIFTGFKYPEPTNQDETPQPLSV